MNRTGIIIGFQDDISDGALFALVKSWEDTSPYNDCGTDSIIVPVDGLTTVAQIMAAMDTAVADFATANGFTYTTLLRSFTTEDDVAAKIAELIPQQAAITNAPADAVTNYNVLTTLLGSLTGAVNDANTKQNQIATQVNAILTALRAAGIIAT